MTKAESRPVIEWLAAHKPGAALAILSLGVAVGGAGLSLWIRLEMRRLNLQLRSQDAALVSEALEELRARDWLYDGRLRGMYLGEANLSSADLREADLQGVVLSEADLSGADLTGANLRDTRLRDANLQGARGLTDAQLSVAWRLWGATMPDGSRYDGRYRLRGDKNEALAQGLDFRDAVEMAAFYEVPLEDYQAGQEWAEQNLKALRRGQLASAAAAPVDPGAIGVLAAVIFSVTAGLLLLQALPDGAQPEQVERQRRA